MIWVCRVRTERRCGGAWTALWKGVGVLNTGSLKQYLWPVSLPLSSYCMLLLWCQWGHGQQLAVLEAYAHIRGVDESEAPVVETNHSAPRPSSGPLQPASS